MIYLKTPASVHLLPLEHTLHPSVKCYWLTVIWCDMYKLAGTLCKMWTKAKYCDYQSYIQALKMESFLILAWWPSGVRESCVSVCSSQSEAGLDATRASLLPPLIYLRSISDELVLREVGGASGFRWLWLSMIESWLNRLISIPERWQFCWGGQRWPTCIIAFWLCQE